MAPAPPVATTLYSTNGDAENRSCQVFAVFRTTSVSCHSVMAPDSSPKRSWRVIDVGRVPPLRTLAAIIYSPESNLRGLDSVSVALSAMSLGRGVFGIIGNCKV